jgi:ankyrin repeat protein
LNGETALITAVLYDETDMVMQLVAEEDINLDLVTADGDSALIKACINPNIEFVRTLVQNKANMNIANMHKNTALHFATENNNIEIVTYLLEQGADADLQNETNGDTPLILAAD